MRILLTNDDGIDAGGLHALAAALRPLGDVTVAAPATNQTGVSRAITLSPTIVVDEIDMPDGGRGFAVAGTPSDCVRFAVLGLPERPDIVVSGSNRGVNLGDDVSYSGTVAAALEGVFLGLPAIAVSQQARGGSEDWYDDARFEYGPTCAVVAQLAQRVFEDGLPDGTMLNVNGPGRDDGPLGVRLTRLGRRIYGTAVTHDIDEAGRRHYRLYDQPPRHHDESGTDLAAVDAGYVSVSPLRLRLDDASAYEQLASWHIEELV
jgi:5'/3'-nucleotidase